MIHISPWEATLQLMAGAARLLPVGGTLFIYGPFRRLDRQTPPSNKAFNAQLRRQNPEWSLRNLEAVVSVAAENDLDLVEVAEMPANNFSVVFRKRDSQE